MRPSSMSSTPSGSSASAASGGSMIAMPPARWTAWTYWRSSSTLSTPSQTPNRAGSTAVHTPIKGRSGKPLRHQAGEDLLGALEVLADDLGGGAVVAAFERVHERRVLLVRAHEHGEGV